ncbi:unnamed protein product [Rhizopus stolonifer]
MDDYKPMRGSRKYHELRVQTFNKRHCWLRSATLTNIKSDASGDKRPDTTLTKFTPTLVWAKPEFC